MTTTPDMPFLDEELIITAPPENRHLYHLPRPCWTRRATGTPIRMQPVTGIIIHKISGMYKFPGDPFSPQLIDEQLLIPMRYSYTVMIYRDGLAVRRVPDPYQAFHAGLSRFEGKEYCNRFMIGICLVSKGKADQKTRALEPDQVTKLVDVCGWFIERDDFPVDRITSHEHARASWNGHHPEKPGESRRGDPGEFPWKSFRDRLKERLHG